MATGRVVIAYDRLGFGRSSPHPGRLDLDFVDDEAKNSLPHLCAAFGLTRAVFLGHSVGGAMAAVAGGQADLIAFGRAFISNPDLPARLAADAPLNEADTKSFYAGEEKGYIDYPALGG